MMPESSNKKIIPIIDDKLSLTISLIFHSLSMAYDNDNNNDSEHNIPIDIIEYDKINDPVISNGLKFIKLKYKYAKHHPNSYDDNIIFTLIVTEIESNKFVSILSYQNLLTNNEKDDNANEDDDEIVSPRSAILSYSKDLKITKEQEQVNSDTTNFQYSNLNEYFKKKNISENDLKQIENNIRRKLTILPFSSSQDKGNVAVSSNDNNNKNDLLRIDNDRNMNIERRINTERSRPNNDLDLPKFEDEYEINTFKDIRSGDNKNPLLHNYGDNDLYPTGQKYPNLNDPNSLNPTAIRNKYGPDHPHFQGGMTFDPLQRNKDEIDQSENRGPGWIPGAKYDDPFGRPPPSGNTGNNLFPGSSGGNNGFGFI
ncbi:Fub1p NDAI_0I00310 [Naumovozyma dairenensis CBS 421]|uniref:PI31 proteasome regulator C-terminal domain-containing protein n=1 Tax=Naumovozyma dairenensis (strain ATCC 10597 / BCRC 20456 / CBS 421 / NBRC 0211 / NRRL Y-12639) TaxID=1071378 RepID=G0WFN9_NAUDC|nr:hypothetical protein NDAI_0I00310 [Naumovozyma dairenensis CBS 421]CCD26600.1 hypothetical protein NDAI_0I00310 [Naumovozyma dairenensis CBS 421]